LDTQNYECADCSKAIGTLFGPAKVCGYTKMYYCDECHVDEMSIIPAKVVYNWNFQTYKVILWPNLLIPSCRNLLVITRPVERVWLVTG
jgi:hypothetical protein